MLHNESQPENAPASISVTVRGIVISLREEQPTKARSPIRVRRDGSFTARRFLHPAKVSLLRERSVSGRMISLDNEEQPLKADSPNEIRAAGIRTDCSILHCEKALFPMVSTVEGRTAVFKDVQNANEKAEMLFNPDGSSISSSAEH